MARGIRSGVILLVWVVWGCGVKPQNPGQCSLNCSNAINVGADKTYSIDTASKPPDFECATGLTQPTEFPGPISTRFVVNDKYTDASGNDEALPVPNISFNPIINGNMVASHTNGENVTAYPAGSVLPDGTTHKVTMYYPYQYIGIVTPKSNWCSDSCGVISLDVWPYCPVGGSSNNLTIQVGSGAKFSDPVQVNINTPTQ